MGHRIEEVRAQKVVNISEAIRTALDAKFSPAHLEVIDESEKHIGHAGYQPGGQSHFRVRMRASAFNEQGRLARHRAVHEAIGKDIMNRIHALALEVDGT